MEHGKETFSKQVEIGPIECEFTDRLDLYLHEEVANGEYEKKKFRVIDTGSIFRLEYDDKCIIMKKRDFVSALMDAMVDNL